jgi:hypothetical protein
MGKQKARTGFVTQRCADDKAPADCGRPADCVKPAVRGQVVEVDVVERVITRLPGNPCGGQPAPRPCVEETLCVEEVIEGLKVKILTGNEFDRNVSQRRLYRYLGSRHQKETLLAAQAIACILIETNKPCPKPVVHPRPDTAHTAGKICYEFSLNTCQLASVISRMVTVMENPAVLSGCKPAVNKPTPVDFLGYAGLRIGFKTKGEVDLIVDPCHNPCAGQCGPEKPGCGCHAAPPVKSDCGCASGGTKGSDDCKCHEKESCVNPATVQAIDLLIRNLSFFVECPEVEGVFGKVFELAEPGQKEQIFRLFMKPACPKETRAAC